MRNSMKNIFKTYKFSSAVILCLLVLSISVTPMASAVDLTSRSILLGSSFSSEVTNHRFKFTTVTPSNIGSVQIEYCSNTPLFGFACVAPAGLNTSSVAILSQSGVTGFSVSPLTTASTIILNRAVSFNGPSAIDINLGNITNPSTDDEVDYVRISVFDNINATGNDFDRGSVVFVVEDRFNIDAYVPPYLTFCVGVTVALNCSNTTGFLANFGEFSRFSPATVTSQMAAATNDESGYNIFINGQTMTSGNNTIVALGSPTASNPGSSQFGINLQLNNNPSVGSNTNGIGQGVPAVGYNTSNLFKFVNGDKIAGSPITTDYNRYTVSYLVNVPDKQAPGVYASTFSYTAVATF